ncbi:hypothetical protein, partial [Cellulosimicrobium sp. CUA-896]|uniref:hypothetical protein n=1 Tax=Cellulosimicrobium sp. CUA-896 TaxID=1517881 RepID=UPI001C9E1F30
RFHAPGASRRGLVTFTAVHVHPLVVAALVGPAVVDGARHLRGDPRRGRRRRAARAPCRAGAVAFAGAAVLVALLVTVLAPEPWVAWVGPLLVLKLVLSHALPHAPAPA